MYKKKEIETTENVIMMSDSYKYSHTNQYPKNTISMYDYAEARCSNDEMPKTVFVGLQYILKKYLSKKIKMKDVKEAKMYADAHGIPFNYKGWKYIAKKLNGKLPIRIKAISEGCVVPTGYPLFTVESTDSKVYWVASWAETILMKIWYTSNIATRSYYVKQMLSEYAEKTSDNPFVLFQYHNFGDRGSSSVESAAIGGLAHLTQFMGSDNFNAMTYAMKYYGVTDITSIASSIPASEHSTTTSWTKENEMDMIMNHIENNKGKPIIAAVCDSYDYYKCVDTITGTKRFREKIDSDEYPIFVIRPDSGNPAEVLPKTLDIIEKNKVPFTLNKKGFKVLNKFRIIWGDGINFKTMKLMLDILVERGYSTENIAFGSGGWLMQQHDRDTQCWAVKCSSITKINENDDEIRTVNVDVFKDPITAPNKKSKKGKVTTYWNKKTNQFEIGNVDERYENRVEALFTVFENGEIIKEYTLDEVRNNSNVNYGDLLKNT